MLVNIITHPAFGVVTFLIGLWGGNHFAIGRDRLKEFNDAAAEFMCAFTNEIRLVEESNTATDFINIFNKAYIRHYNALIRFQAYLSESGRTELKKAWNNHCFSKSLDEYERTLPSAKFSHYDHSQGIERVEGKPSISEEHEVSFERAKTLAIKNLDTILSFSKFK